MERELIEGSRTGCGQSLVQVAGKTDDQAVDLLSIGGCQHSAVCCGQRELAVRNLIAVLRRFAVLKGEECQGLRTEHKDAVLAGIDAVCKALRRCLLVLVNRHIICLVHRGEGVAGQVGDVIFHGIHAVLGRIRKQDI